MTVFYLITIILSIRQSDHIGICIKGDSITIGIRIEPVVRDKYRIGSWSGSNLGFVFFNFFYPTAEKNGIFRISALRWQTETPGGRFGFTGGVASHWNAELGNTATGNTVI